MALGRSLHALLSESDSAKQRKENQTHAPVRPMPSIGDEVAADESTHKEGFKNIPLNLLVPSKYQPRQFFDEGSLEELAKSIKDHGLLEPLLVRKAPVKGKFEIVCGERRYRAAKLAGVTKVPCIVSDMLEQEAYAAALIENLHREDLNPIEQAIAYAMVLKECSLTQEGLAQVLGMKRSSISNIIRLNNLDEAVKEYVAAGQLDVGHAKALLAIEDKNVQSKTARYVVQKGLNVRQTELLIKQVLDKDSNREKPRSFRPILFDDFEKKLAAVFKGAKVKFSVSGEDKGKLILSYANKEQLDSILKTFGLTKIKT